MHKTTWRIASLITVLAMLISAVGVSGTAYAAPRETHTAAASMPNGMTLVEAAKVGVSAPLSAIGNRPIVADPPSYLKQNPERLLLPKTSNGGFNAPVTLDAVLPNNMPATEANFEGVDNVAGVLPPDTDGDIGYDPITGNKYYIQWVNLHLQIWDVTNPAAPVALLAAPVPGNALFTGFGGICEANNDGDPITLFDPIANRWFISQFALGFPDDFHQCVAVSASGDPMGSWYLYDFMTSDVMMNDYPKFGVWPDGYYMSVNQFDGATFDWGGAGVAVMERSQMLQGLPARMIYVDLGAETLNYGGILPSDLDGPAPAYGTPNYFMEWDDSSWLGDPADTLRMWEFDVDWVTPANTTFGADAAFTPNTMLATANVNLMPCVIASNRNCIDQPDTTQNLDAIGDRLMFRLQYRDFGTYQTLVTNHTVDAGSGRAGVHWMELRDTGAGWAIYQDDVFAPADTESRWMGSIAMDDSGNIALGYSVSSGTVYPSIRYTGRLTGDPLNDMPQGEGTVINGTGSQTHSAARWGDYSKMSVDPEDGCTFWYTQEYMQTTSSADWQTRVGSFKFPSCTSLPTGTLSGTVTDGVNPLAGVSIDVDATYHTVTNASGNYSLELPDGTYSVVASKYGYTSSTAPAVVVTSPNVTDQDFTLTVAASSTISGIVTDLGGGWPLYARIDIAGYPASPIYTHPVTGAYSVDLVDGPYTFTVVPLSGGYTPSGTPIVVAGNATHDFALTANTTCTAPGYTAGATLLSEGFEGTFPPTGWTLYETGGDAVDWTQGPAGTQSHGTAHSGATFAFHDDDFAATTGFESWMVTPQFTVPADGGTLSFWQRGYWGTYYTFHAVAITTDASADPNTSTYNLLWNGNTAEAWSQSVIDLSAYAGQNVYVAFYYEGDFSDEWYVDDVSVQGACHPISGAGLVVGNVYDANTLLTMPVADVVDASMNHALFVNNSGDITEDAPLYIYAAPAGAVELTASALGFANDVQNPTVVAGSTIRQDFNLGSGFLTADPASLTFDVTISNPTGNLPVALDNTGSADAGYRIFAIPGTFNGYAPTGPFAANTRHVGPKNLMDKIANMRIPYEIPNVPTLNAGTVIDSWDTGLVYPWGIAYDTDANEVWVGNIGAGGGDDLNYGFLPDGTPTGDTIDTSSWLGVFGGDMTYNPFTQTIWQVNVGGDNCIYEMDPTALIPTGNSICPLFGTSERGLAFDPLTNTYYAGSWNDGIINHFAPDGTMLASVAVDLPVAGLAFNPTTGHLFAITSNDGSPDVYVLDTNTPNYDIIGAFYIKDGAAWAVNGAQAGLEIDCDGNLWTVNQTTGEVFVAESGETGVCDWQASWLSVAPTSGTVTAAGSDALTASVDATGMPGGTYQGYLRIVNDTPYGDEVVPVTMNVTVFEDVPNTHWANDFIEALYNNGIAGGCSATPLNYCPNANVTRAQMAIFVLVAEHGTGYRPPAPTGNVFADVDQGDFAAAWIEQLAAEDITAGCGGGNFCPNAPVSRAEMAVFILRGVNGSTYTPPAAVGGIFDDVPSNFWAAAWIEQLFADGITGGCGDGSNYCPNSPVTRAQMAVFVSTAFGLIP